MKCAIAIVVSCALAISGLAQTQKNYKDQGEYEMFSEAGKDFGAGNHAKAITDLDAWAKKYPDSEFKDDRQILYVLAYAGANQQGKALDAAAGLVSQEPDKLFANSADRIRLLYTLVTAVQKVADPSEHQRATASEAARQLIAIDKAPAEMKEEDWARAREGLQASARGALLFLALVPVAKSMKTSDCAAAEEAALNAIEGFPDSVQVAWYLGTAQICLARKNPGKASSALYELARAATLDPIKGLVDPKWQQTVVVPYFEKAYTQYHGEDPEGLRQLRVLCGKSPLSPPAFLVKSLVQIADEKQADLESKSPELALWLKIKAALSASDGEQYFASSLKGAAVPQLVGTLVGATPECRPTELRVAIGSEPQITVKLSKPLAGRPALDREFRWEGIPVEFVKSPFMLTMDAETAKISGLTTIPCGTGPGAAIPAPPD